MRDAGRLVDARTDLLGRGRLLQCCLGDWGGREFAPNAGQATREQQIIVAERIRASVGFGAWGCAKRVGLTGR
jgi:Transglycosylase-like domain